MTGKFYITWSKWSWCCTIFIDCFTSLIVSPPNSHDSHSSSQPVRHIAKCNFDMINSDLNLVDWSVVFSSSVTADDFWSAFLNVINESLNSHCPMFTPNLHRSNSKFIYPPNIKRLQSDKKRIWRRFHSDKSNSLIREQYKLACACYRDAVNEFHYKIESSVLSERNASTYYKFIKMKFTFHFYPTSLMTVSPCSPPPLMKFMPCSLQILFLSTHQRLNSS